MDKNSSAFVLNEILKPLGNLEHFDMVVLRDFINWVMEHSLNIIVLVHFLEHVPIDLSFSHLSLCLKVNDTVDTISLHGFNIIQTKWVGSNKDFLLI